MKRASILAAIAVSFAAPAAIAQSVNVEITRGDATNIRSCPSEFGGAFSDVCYNRVTTSLFWLGPVPTPFTRTKERVTQLNCDRKISYKPGTTRASIAAEFCPQVSRLPNIVTMAN
jgi:hypothetical protein